ncbi:hypothetical protein LINGRAHAP2_LOCUS11826 [Linum grandiflorum]
MESRILLRILFSTLLHSASSLHLRNAGTVSG